MSVAENELSEEDATSTKVDKGVGTYKRDVILRSYAR